MFKLKCGKFMPYFAPDTGADGGASASSGDGADGTGTPDTTDYKALYEKAIADSKKLKASFDQTAHEVAELKKAQKAKMSEDEVKAAENAEKEQRYQEMAAKVAEMETATKFAESGFDKKDYGELAAKIVEVGGEKSGELAEIIIAFAQAVAKSSAANARNAVIKDGAVPPKTSTAKTDGNTKTDYQLYQESKTKTNNIVEL